MSKVLVVDPTKCTGCRLCELTCSLKKEGELNPTKSRVKAVRYDQEYFYYPHVCLQCEVPFCAMVCPTRALQKNPESGVVELTKERCVGCKLCLVACPFGSITMVDGVAAKCDLCGGEPACVKQCGMGALSYGEARDIGWGKRMAVGEKLKTPRVEAGVESAEFARRFSLTLK